MCQFSDLAADIIMIIAENLELKELCAFRSTCRGLNKHSTQFFVRQLPSTATVQMTDESLTLLATLVRLYRPRILEVCIIIPAYDEEDKDSMLDLLSEEEDDRANMENAFGDVKWACEELALGPPSWRWNSLLEHLQTQRSYIASAKYICVLESIFAELEACTTLQVRTDDGMKPRPLGSYPKVNSFVPKFGPRATGFLGDLFAPLLAIVSRSKTLRNLDFAYMNGGYWPATMGIDFHGFDISIFQSPDLTHLTALRLRLESYKFVRSRNSNLSLLLSNTSNLRFLHLHFENQISYSLFDSIILPSTLEYLTIEGLEVNPMRLFRTIRTASNLKKLSLFNIFLDRTEQHIHWVTLFESFFLDLPNLQTLRLQGLGAYYYDSDTQDYYWDLLRFPHINLIPGGGFFNRFSTATKDDRRDMKDDVYQYFVLKYFEEVVQPKEEDEFWFWKDHLNWSCKTLERELLGK
jgi:hypothetical protein